MSFLNPILLAGLAGISIPILIHLLNRRRFRRLPWAAMRYLKASVERNQRRMKLQDWILLALRCLLVALLAVTLARPAVRAFSGAWLEAQGATVVVLDRSGSMTALDGNGSRFDQARAAASSALASVPAGSTAVLLPVPWNPEGPPFLAPEEGGRDWASLLDELGPTAAAADLAPAVARALEHLEAQPAARRELVLISDRQQLAWRELDAITAGLGQAGSGLETYAVLVGGPDRPNPAARQLGISGLQAGLALTAAGKPARFDITVGNHGTDLARSVPVRLLINGSPAGEPLEIAAIPAGESATVQSYLQFPQPGYHHVRAELPDDLLPADNARTAIVRVFQQVRILLVDGDPGVQARDAETFFLRHALAPAGGTADGSVVIEVVEPRELAGKALEDCAAVFLANVPELAPELAAALSRYVREGGGLVIFPGDRVNAAFYNRELSTRAGLMPATMGDRWKTEPGKRLAGEAASHALLAAWSEPEFGSLAEARFREGYVLNLPEPAPAGVAVVLRFEDGAPALIERRIERGWVYLFASTADTAWNDLAVRPLFVPLLRQLAGRIAGGADEALQVQAGTAFHYPLPAAFAGKPAVIYPLDGREAKGVRMPGGEAVDGAAIHYANTLMAGAYEASIDHPPLRLLFAVQPAVEESSAGTLTPAQLATLGSAARVVSWTPGMELGEILAAQRAGAELWKLLLAGVFVLAVTESFVAQRFSRPK